VNSRPFSADNRLNRSAIAMVLGRGVQNRVVGLPQRWLAGLLDDRGVIAGRRHTGVVPYDPTIYRGSAAHYRYGRPAYSPGLEAVLAQEMSLDGTGAGRRARTDRPHGGGPAPAA
jgi:hypothetical protein